LTLFFLVTDSTEYIVKVFSGDTTVVAPENTLLVRFTHPTRGLHL